ncbi:hypothetical protein J6590_098749 [Homalodisca vitripennis]|nr:hypothetical protein J6590_098749 [Homalodisca vitripennis]
MESVTPPILSLNLLGDINSGGYFAKWHSLYTSRPRPVNSVSYKKRTSAITTSSPPNPLPHHHSSHSSMACYYMSHKLIITSQQLNNFVISCLIAALESFY